MPIILRGGKTLSANGLKVKKRARTPFRLLLQIRPTSTQWGAHLGRGSSGEKSFSMHLPKHGAKAGRRAVHQRRRRGSHRAEHDLRTAQKLCSGQSKAEGRVGKGRVKGILKHARYMGALKRGSRNKYCCVEHTLERSVIVTDIRPYRAGSDSHDEGKSNKTNHKRSKKERNRERKETDTKTKRGRKEPTKRREYRRQQPTQPPPTGSRRRMQ